MAYKLILQAKLEYNLCGFLPWTYGNKYGKVNVLQLSYAKRGVSSSVFGLGDQSTLW